MSERIESVTANKKKEVVEMKSKNYPGDCDHYICSRPWFDRVESCSEQQF